MLVCVWKSLVYASPVVKLEENRASPHARWTWIHVWNLPGPAKCGSICRSAWWLNRTGVNRTTSAARQSPQHRMFRCERASPTSTPAFCSIRLVCLCMCMCGCLVKHRKCILSNTMSFIMCYQAINLSAFTFRFFSSLALTPTSLWLTGCLCTIRTVAVAVVGE